MDTTPRPEEVVQSEDSERLQPIPVEIATPLETRELPAKFAGYRTEPAVGTGVGARLLTLEPRRKSAVILSMDQDLWISGSQAGAQAGFSSAFRVKANVPFTIDHMDEVWACAVTGVTDVSVMSIFWSE